MNDSSPYRDFSRATETDLLKLTPHCSDKKAAAAAQNFPMKLHYMISEMEKDGQSHVISWHHHGRCFSIHDREAIEKFLPLWFRQTKLSSLQRQFSFYGFTYIHSGPDQGAYYHELFLRGKPFLARWIQSSGKGPKGKRSDKKKLPPPNFGAFPVVPSSSSGKDTSRVATVKLNTSTSASSAGATGTTTAGASTVAAPHRPTNTIHQQQQQRPVTPEQQGLVLRRRLMAMQQQQQHTAMPSMTSYCLSNSGSSGGSCSDSTADSVATPPAAAAAVAHVNTNDANPTPRPESLALAALLVDLFFKKKATKQQQQQQQPVMTPQLQQQLPMPLTPGLFQLHDNSSDDDNNNNKSTRLLQQSLVQQQRQQQQQQRERTIQSLEGAQHFLQRLSNDATGVGPQNHSAQNTNNINAIAPLNYSLLGAVPPTTTASLPTIRESILQRLLSGLK